MMRASRLSVASVIPTSMYDFESNVPTSMYVMGATPFALRLFSFLVDLLSAEFFFW
jgi:hypothetical protein